MIMFLGLTIIDIRLAFIYLVFVFYLSRVIEEEHILMRNKLYKEYMCKTGMFIPKLWRKS